VRGEGEDADKEFESESSLARTMDFGIQIARMVTK
jgi:hypothetical protein